MIGKVTVWQMTEEQRLAYIAKHPIIPTEPIRGSKFSNVHTMKRNKSLKHDRKKG